MFILLPVDTFRTLATVHALTQNMWLCEAVTLCLSLFFFFAFTVFCFSLLPGLVSIKQWAYHHSLNGSEHCSEFTA